MARFLKVVASVSTRHFPSRQPPASISVNNGPFFLVIRNSISFSALLGKNVSFSRIRANRTPKQGLKSQHKTGIELVQQLCSAQVQGCEVGSNELTFKPGELKPGGGEVSIYLTIKTPALIEFMLKVFSLLQMQSLLDALLF